MISMLTIVVRANLGVGAIFGSFVSLIMSTHGAQRGVRQDRRLNTASSSRIDVSAGGVRHPAAPWRASRSRGKSPPASHDRRQGTVRLPARAAPDRRPLPFGLTTTGIRQHPSCGCSARSRAHCKLIRAPRTGLPRMRSRLRPPMPPISSVLGTFRNTPVIAVVSRAGPIA